MYLSIADTKTWTDILTNIAEIAALVIGGIWTYRRFIKKRAPYPKAVINHDISRVKLSEDKILIHIKTTFNNIGEILIQLRHRETWLQQITPLSEEITAGLETNNDSVHKNMSEIEWPLLDSHEIEWAEEEAELEPGELEYFHDDFIINAGVEVVMAYSHIKNVEKKNREIGWQCTTIFDIQKGLAIKGGENANERETITTKR
ncbi:MAG: hypothetical protein NT002_03460 [candidate division Zixibacteria bacterium]|nr:hypothetical protein [candidate division Zixibacteria bacterium]